MKVLSAQELHRVQGAFSPVGAAIGALGASADYPVGQQISGDKFSPTKLAGYAAGGAIADGTAGPVGSFGFNGALAGSSIRGVAERQGW